jgi:hypothetical protein
MPTARIITHNPESTEALAAYLRDEGYDVAYADPGEAQSSSAELTIHIEACPTPLEALARARELAASSGCDVFVGEGIVEQLDLARAEAQPEAAAESLEVAPTVPDASAVQNEAAEFAAARAELSNQVPDFVVKQISSLPLVETSECERTVAPEISCSEAQEFEPTDSRTQGEEPARHRPSIGLGRVLASSGKLAGLRVSAWFVEAYNAFQLLEVRASARLERLLLRQQLRAAILGQRLEEQRRLADEKRLEATRQAAVQREEARHKLAQQPSGSAKPESPAHVIFKIVRTSLHLGHRWIVDRLAKRADSEKHQEKITPIRTSQQTAGRRGIRDWKMALAGAGFAALLVLFVLGVFTGRGPETAEIQAARKTLQLSTTARPVIAGGIPHTTAAPATPVAALDTNATNVTPPKPTQSMGSSANLPSQPTTAARSRLRRPRVAPADAEQEVIVRHFHRSNHPAAKVAAGVKHYSDLD